MTYIMSCVWLDYMVKCFQCKNCVGSSPKTKKCVASFLVPGDKKKKTPHGRLFLFGAEGNAEPVQGVSLCPDETRKETLTVSFHTILPSDGDKNTP